MSSLSPSGVTDFETTSSIRTWLYKSGAGAALVILAVFLIGFAGIVSAAAQLTTTDGWFAALQSNWLVVLFWISAGFGEAQRDLLNVVNPLDIVIMVLFCTMSVALLVALWRTSKIWSVLATSLPVLGIPVFLITGMAGRSALFFGAMIICAVMLRSDVFGKLTAYSGIVAGALLFFGGDIGTAIFTQSNIIAVLIVIGYALWMVFLDRPPAVPTGQLTRVESALLW
jgi:hypothetical protein